MILFVNEELSDCRVLNLSEVKLINSKRIISPFKMDSLDFIISEENFADSSDVDIAEKEGLKVGLGSNKVINIGNQIKKKNGVIGGKFTCDHNGCYQVVTQSEESGESSL